MSVRLADRTLPAAAPALLNPGDVNRHLEGLVTPALVLNLPALERNLDRMATEITGPSLRPHAKTHKCVQIAERQLARGASGITTATVWEAKAMADAGIEDVLIANQVVGRPKIAVACDIADATRLTVAVDDLDNLKELSASAMQRGVEVGVLIEIDVGMGRSGVRTPQRARSIAEAALSLPGIALRGVMGYEGHCVMEPNRRRRRASALAAVETLLRYAEALADEGFPVGVVSAGGTGTFDMTGHIEGITELQVGSYALMDAAYKRIAPKFEVAVTVLATVISRHGRTAVLDAGRKTLSIDFGPPKLIGYDARVRYVAEEHMVCDAPAKALKLGDRVAIASGHCCATVNLHDVYYVTDGRELLDIWPIVARGAGTGSQRPG